MNALGIAYSQVAGNHQVTRDGALTGVDPDDPATAASAGKASADYTRSLDHKGLQGARIGVVRKYFGFLDAVDVLMNAAEVDNGRTGRDAAWIGYRQAGGPHFSPVSQCGMIVLSR